MKTVPVVNLDFNDLVNGVDMSDKIIEAYGKDGLGVLTVSNVPNVLELRRQLLPLSYQFAHLPKETLAKYEDKTSGYNFGWSHGKEKFNGKPDTAKGSFYANPTLDVPTTDQELVKKFPFYCSPNIWPKEDVSQLETAFKNMGQLIVDVGLLVAKQCDKTSAKANGFSFGENRSLADTIKASRCTKGRLLFYFPLDKPVVDGQEDEDNFDSWCGWHNDHGSLTGLTSGMYFDAEGNEVENRDEKAGLFIKTRHGEVVRAVWPADKLAFQIGESSQIHTGGALVATPHCVRGSSVMGVSRATLAVFMQPNWDVVMEPPKSVAIEKCGLEGVTDGMDFTQFSEQRFSVYYGSM